MELSSVMTQYIKRGRRYLKSTEQRDERGQNIPGTGKRSKGYKKGVMVAGVDESGTVVIGFSMCHPNDKFDFLDGERVDKSISDPIFFDTVAHPRYVGGKKVDGFGKDLAMKRAIKWKNYTGLVLTQECEENTPGIVRLPKSIEDAFVKFCGRATRYYKDKRFSAWIE